MRKKSYFQKIIIIHYLYTQDPDQQTSTVAVDKYLKDSLLIFSSFFFLFFLTIYSRKNHTYLRQRSTLLYLARINLFQFFFSISITLTKLLLLYSFSFFKLESNCFSFINEHHHLNNKKKDKIFCRNLISMKLIRLAFFLKYKYISWRLPNLTYFFDLLFKLINSW